MFNAYQIALIFFFFDLPKNRDHSAAVAKPRFKYTGFRLQRVRLSATMSR